MFHSFTNQMASRVEILGSNHESSESPPPPRKTTVKRQKVLTGRVTKARGSAKKYIKLEDKEFEDPDADAGDDVPDGSGEEKGFHKDEEVAAHIKEEVMA